MIQDEALNLLKKGHNVFLTGPAGSGKTFTLIQYMEYLSKKKIPFSVTASTGIAATHLNGITVHSWSGIGIKDSLTRDDFSEMLGRVRLHDNIETPQVLIIDEISMLDAKRLDMIDKVCKVFRRNEEPFGGLQVVMCGDFFQLPPVKKDNTEIDNFAWKANIWQNMNLKIAYLTEQYRQSDMEFLTVLNNVRNNLVTKDDLDLLQSRHNKEVDGFDKPTKLYTHNENVDAINNMELAKLTGKPHTYQMYSTGPDKLVDMLKKNCLAPEELILKKDALVMFVRNNFDKGYVNGTLGKVIGFDKEGYPKVLTAGGNEVIAEPESWRIENRRQILAEISQVPLRLAWAITVHKSQGMSLDAAEIDLSKAFVPGMGYVALSRLRGLYGLKLLGLNEMALKINQEVAETDKIIMKMSEDIHKNIN